MASPKFSKTNVEQTIDLKEVFGVDFRGMTSLKEAIGGAIIERIRDRTAKGEGISFTGDTARKVKLKSPYSKEYADSLEFKAFGKSRNSVNMKLTGDMLGLMDIKLQSGNQITIGWNDAEENAKAYNHSVGDTVPRRPFFGVSKSELKEIAKEFESEINEALKNNQSDQRKAFESQVANLIASLTSGGQDGES